MTVGNLEIWPESWVLYKMPHFGQNGGSLIERTLNTYMYYKINYLYIKCRAFLWLHAWFGLISFLGLLRPG